MKNNKPNKNTSPEIIELGEWAKKSFVRTGEDFVRMGEDFEHVINKVVFPWLQEKNDLQQNYEKSQVENQHLREQYTLLHNDKEELDKRYKALLNEYRNYKIAESKDITFDSMKFREQFDDFKTQRFNSFVDQIYNLEMPEHEQEDKAIRRFTIKEILTRNIFLKLNSSVSDIVDDIYLDLAWKDLSSQKALNQHLIQFISECHRLVRTAWRTTPEIKILVYRKGTSFNPDTHEVPPSYKETGEITDVLSPACLIESKVLVKALVLTEHESFSEDDFATERMIPDESKVEGEGQAHMQEPALQQAGTQDQAHVQEPALQGPPVHDQPETREEEATDGEDLQGASVAVSLTQPEDGHEGEQS